MGPHPPNLHIFRSYPLCPGTFEALQRPLWAESLSGPPRSKKGQQAACRVIVVQIAKGLSLPEEGLATSLTAPLPPPPWGQPWPAPPLLPASALLGHW